MKIKVERAIEIPDKNCHGCHPDYYNAYCNWCNLFGQPLNHTTEDPCPACLKARSEAKESK